MVKFLIAKSALKHDDFAVDLLEVVLEINLACILLVTHVTGELLQAFMNHLKKSIGNGNKIDFSLNIPPFCAYQKGSYIE